MAGPADPSHHVTGLLNAWAAGDAGALGHLAPAVYDELRRRAQNFLRREAPGHTLQPTALVHEAYLRLVDQRQAHWQSRSQFFGVAAQLMRRILVDHARAHHAVKRGGAAVQVTLDEAAAPGRGPDVDVLALDEALTRLAALDPRQARVVELRYFAGLGIEEVAGLLGVSPATVKREWVKDRTWLKLELGAR